MNKKNLLYDSAIYACICAYMFHVNFKLKLPNGSPRQILLINVYLYKNVVKNWGNGNYVKISKRTGKFPFIGKNRVITR